MKAKITVVGSLNTDLIFKVRRLPVPGETLIGEDLRFAPGGKGANQAVAAARLGAEVAMVGCVGDDSFGSKLQEGLTREGISTEHLYKKMGATSGTALITVAEDGQNTIVLAPGANFHLSPDMVYGAEGLLKTCDAVLVQLEIPLHIVELAVQVAKHHNRCIILNPAPAQELGPGLLELVDYLVPNEVEAAALTGQEVTDIESAESAGRTLQEMCKGAVVVITLGSRGALLVGKGGKGVAIPAPSVTAVDATAAGDAFVGGMAVALAKGKPDPEAVREGCVAGGLAATRLGAQTSLPTEAEVGQLLSAGKIV
jgi:ribokinase